MNTNEIILFGDAMGTKHHLKNLLFNQLAVNMHEIHNSFSRTFMDYYLHSRNLHCYTISDSVIAKWTNELEGIRYCLPFAIDFYKNIKHPYRVFIDSGKSIKNKTGYGKLANHISERYQNLLPISFGLWSVSVAESAHFPTGIYVGQDICKKLSSKFKFDGVYEVQDFTYKMLKL